MILVLFFKLLNDEEFITYLKIQKELLEMNEETNRIILQNLLKIFLDRQEQISQEIREQFLREVIIFIKHIQKQEELFNTPNFHTIGKFWDEKGNQ